KHSDDRNLIRYLYRNRHTSPFEMVETKWHVRLPIFVARQLIRHRTASVNEYSLRYSLPSFQFYVPPPENVCKQSKNNKQGRGEPLAAEHYETAAAIWENTNIAAAQLYRILVSEDIDLARELARMHLPVSLYTEWYWKIDLHNLFHFLTLRTHAHAQKEIRDYAHIKAAILKRCFPIAFEAWVDYAFASRTFSRLELEMLLDGFKGSPSWDQEQLQAKYRVTKREVEEFISKTSTKPQVPSFELDLSLAKSAEHFQQEVAKSVP